MYFTPENAALLAVVICLFYSVFSGYALTVAKGTQWGLKGVLWDTNFTRWAAEGNGN
jgi:hypothetical protein